jgi:hypothetical protein
MSSSAPRPLHVHCGDSSAGGLRAAGVPGEVIVWCDLLHAGRLPPTDDPAAWRACRAEVLSASTGGVQSRDACRAHLERQDAALARAGACAEVVLWFDACLYDQLILVRQLDHFARAPAPPARLSLLCVGEVPGMPRYRGLGELRPDQFAALLPARHAVTPAESATARAAWAALRAPTFQPLLDLLAAGTTALPYLEAALRRFLDELPAADSGLTRLEREILEAVAAGAHTPGRLFAAVSDREERPFFGDTTLWQCVNGLAAGPDAPLCLDGPSPLPQWNPPPDLSPWSMHLSAGGEALLAGRRGLGPLRHGARWHGGVHLAPDDLWLRSPAGDALLHRRGHRETVHPLPPAGAAPDAPRSPEPGS